MKTFTLSTLLLCAFAFINAQDWIEIPIPNADFTDTTTVGTIAAEWAVLTPGENAAREQHEYEGTNIWCGVLGYTGDGTDKRGAFYNFLDETVPEEDVDYKLSTPYTCSWIAAAKIDSFQFVASISAWETGTDSTLRTVIATNSAWVSTMGEWYTIECFGSLTSGNLDAVKGKHIVVEFDILDDGMKDGATIGVLASWVRFSMPKLEYDLTTETDPETDIDKNSSTSSKVFAAQNYLNILNNEEQSTTLMMYDLSGKILMQKQLNNANSQISLDNFRSGIYVVTLKNIGGIQTHKVYVK